MPERNSGTMFESSGPAKGLVMVVEHDPEMREELRTTLTEAGYSVIEVEDGEEAIQAMHAGSNQLLVGVLIASFDQAKGMQTLAYFKEQFPSISLMGMTGLPKLAMGSTPRTKIVILGGGKGGSALLDLFSHLPGLEMVGITDRVPHAPALARARELGIPVVDDAVSLLASEGTHLIVDVTGDPGMPQVIAKQKSPGAEVLGGAAAKLLWNVVQHEADMQAHAFQTETVASMISQGMILDYLVKPVDETKLIASVTKAMEQREIHRL